MTITKVIFSKKFPTGAYLNEDIGFEMSLERYDTNQEKEAAALYAVDYLRNLAEQSHKKKYPHLYTLSGSPVFVEQVQETRSEEEISRSQQIEGYKELIKLADTPQKLERHRGNIEKLNDPELKTLFDNKLKSLQ